MNNLSVCPIDNVNGCDDKWYRLHRMCRFLYLDQNIFINETYISHILRILVWMKCHLKGVKIILLEILDHIHTLRGNS